MLDVSSMDRVFREEGPVVLATMIRLVGGDFQLAEDALQDAMATALEKWPVDGVPDNPGAWLMTTARRKGIDRLRRENTAREKAPVTDAAVDAGRVLDTESALVGPIPDDQLRLIFTCCHPALGLEAQVALTLRTLGGLSTPEIAKAFLVPEATLAQRLVRAKKKIKNAGIPYEVPDADELADRTTAVLAVVYLIFNEGYAATTGDTVVRRVLCADAIRLGRVLRGLLPEDAEVEGLLALMLLHDSRRETRADADGRLILLEDQDRAEWDRQRIDEGLALVRTALERRDTGPYQIQAAIAAVHAQAEDTDATDWEQIAALYQALYRLNPSPVIRLNQAAAVSKAFGPARGLEMVDALSDTLDEYHLFHAARADMLRRLEQYAKAEAAYRRALELADNVSVRAFLESRIQAMVAAQSN